MSEAFELGNTPCTKCENYAEFPSAKLTNIDGLAHPLYVTGICLRGSDISLVTLPDGHCCWNCTWFIEAKRKQEQT